MKSVSCIKYVMASGFIAFISLVGATGFTNYPSSLEPSRVQKPAIQSCAPSPGCLCTSGKCSYACCYDPGK